MWTCLLRSMTELSSRKWISQLTGKFAQSSASRKLIPRFALTYKINVAEAEKQLHEYKTLNEFFTRRLKPGMRTVDNDPNVLVSPVDAIVTGIGHVTAGALVNVKGQNYTIAELLNNYSGLHKFVNGYFIVLYLSPTDYHRIHTPLSGTVVAREHVLGKVYPVNEFGLRHMKRVLSRNERLNTFIQHTAGEVAVVKVGAMNVSSIQYVQPLHDEVNKGDELAYFEFGSTVVLVTENEMFTPDEHIQLGSAIRMGGRLGTLR